MVIENAKYIKHLFTKKVHQIKVQLNGIESFVPLDPDNTDYQAILEWVAEGNTIQEAD
jgi:hypothetical protein